MFSNDDIIHSYTRKQAIEDGVLVDVSETAKEAGIRFPTALTHAVWARYVEFEPETEGQSIAGRLWDILWMLAVAARKAQGSEIIFQLYVAIPDAGNWEANEQVPEHGSSLSRETHRLVSLKAICGPGDDPAPVLTVMLPNED